MVIGHNFHPPLECHNNSRIIFLTASSSKELSILDIVWQRELTRVGLWTGGGKASPLFNLFPVEGLVILSSSVSGRNFRFLDSELSSILICASYKPLARVQDIVLRHTSFGNAFLGISALISGLLKPIFSKYRKMKLCAYIVYKLLIGMRKL